MVKEGAVVVLLLFQKKPQKDDRLDSEVVYFTIFEGFVPLFIDYLSKWAAQVVLGILICSESDEQFSLP